MIKKTTQHFLNHGSIYGPIVFFTGISLVCVGIIHLSISAGEPRRQRDHYAEKYINCMAIQEKKTLGIKTNCNQFLVKYKCFITKSKEIKTDIELENYFQNSYGEIHERLVEKYKLAGNEADKIYKKMYENFKKEMNYSKDNC